MKIRLFNKLNPAVFRFLLFIMRLRKRCWLFQPFL